MRDFTSGCAASTFWCLTSTHSYVHFMGSVLNSNKADMIVSYKTVILCSTRKSYSSKWNVSISSWTGGKFTIFHVSVFCFSTRVRLQSFFFCFWTLLEVKEGGELSKWVKPLKQVDTRRIPYNLYNPGDSVCCWMNSNVFGAFSPYVLF